MYIRTTLLVLSSMLVLSACGSGGHAPRAEFAPPATNEGGGPSTAILTARFDPANAVVPFPTNLLFSGTGDLTLNIPIADPTAPSAGPLLALNSLDGWSTVAPWSTTLSGPVDPSTVVAGDSVRWFEVQLNRPAGAPVGLVRELVPGVDYVVTVSNTNPQTPSIVLVPLRPLDEITSYMVVLTDDIADPAGNNATPAQTYFLAQRTTPLVNEAGQSTDPLIPDASARALEPLRQLTNAQEAVAAAAGIPRSEIVLSWVATTQSITTVTAAAHSLVEPQFSQLAQTPITTSIVGGAGIADVYIGVMNVPYYLEAPTAENPTGPLNGFWEAEPGAYVPPFDQFGLDPTSTNITFLNPFPVEKSVQTIPVLMTIPNASSGRAMPDSGWPVVIFQHGITGNRSNALALADSMALAGFAVVAIDLPLHGVASVFDESTNRVLPPRDNLLYIENTPFRDIAQERTFDVDYINNVTGAPGPDGFSDSSGAHMINLSSLRTSRDNLRQASIDLATLTATVPTMDFNGDGLPDFDGSQIRFVGQSLGSMTGIPFLTVEPTVQTGVFSVPGGGIIGLLLGSPTFGPRIVNGLAAAGIQQGTAEFEQFVFAAQTVIDPADPINWAEAVVATNQGVLVQEVLGDTVIPNAVPGFPLSGTEPLIRIMDLMPITQTTQDPSGIKGATRLVEGSHGSLLDPRASRDATIEMQGEAASMAASNGTAVQVTIPSVLQGN